MDYLNRHSFNVKWCNGIFNPGFQCQGSRDERIFNRVNLLTIRDKSMVRIASDFNPSYLLVRLQSSRFFVNSIRLVS